MGTRCKALPATLRLFYFLQMNYSVPVMASAFVCPVFLVCAVTHVLLSTTGILQGKAVYNVIVTPLGLSEATVMIPVSARARQTSQDGDVTNALMATMVLQLLEGE